jgi:hypothetical protein
VTKSFAPAELRVAHKCACIEQRYGLWQKHPAKPDAIPSSMNTKIVGLNLLLAMLMLSEAPGQSASPAGTPKPVVAATPAPGSTPVVKVRIVVHCDEAAIRTLVENSLRSALAKSKDVTVLSGPGSSHIIIGLKLVPAGVKAKFPLYALEFSIFDTPALFNSLEAAGLNRKAIYTLLVANEVQPIREDNILTVVSKDQIPAKMESFVPEIQTHGVERARIAITLNQQRKTNVPLDTDSVREEVP